MSVLESILISKCDDKDCSHSQLYCVLLNRSEAHNNRDQIRKMHEEKGITKKNLTSTHTEILSSYPFTADNTVTPQGAKATIPVKRQS